MRAVLGLFTYVDALLEAAGRLKDSGYGVTIFSPIPLGHEIEHTLGGRKNHIRYFAFFGAVIGFIFGVLLTLGTAAMYVLPRGGKPIFSITPTLLISYETASFLACLQASSGFAYLQGFLTMEKRYMTTRLDWTLLDSSWTT